MAMCRSFFIAASMRPRARASLGGELAADDAAGVIDEAVDEGIVGGAVHLDDREARLRQCHGRHFPIAEMAGEEDGTLVGRVLRANVLRAHHLDAAVVRINAVSA